MLDVNVWSKFYWEHPDNHWQHLADEITTLNPREAAIHIANKIKKINNDYFQECSELSLGYYPTVETEKKYKKLKKLLGEKLSSINLNDWLMQLKSTGDSGDIFLYYFQKHIELKNVTEVIEQLPNYDSVIIHYLKNEIINENDNYKKENLHTFLCSHLQTMIKNPDDDKRINIVMDFFNKENEQIWFKNNLNNFLSYETFLIYIANAIEYSDISIKEVTDFLNNHAQESKLLDFNTNILSYIESFTNEERLQEFVQRLPLESYKSFTKIVAGDITTNEGLQKWYEIVTKTEKHPKDFFEKIWDVQKNIKGMKIVFTIEQDSILLDFIAEKMTHFYCKEELENYNFNNSIIRNKNLQEIMQKKLNYYYLSNKLLPHNTQTKKLKI